MVKDILKKQLENEGIDKFIYDNKLQLKKSYQHLIGSYQEILGKTDESYVFHSSFWEILKIHPTVQSFFYALNGKYFPYLETLYFQNPVAKKIISMILEMLKREFPEEI